MTRAVLYMRVSTADQTVENQRRELLAAAAYKGWDVTAEYGDEGISGAKSRKDRPQLDLMLKDAVAGKFDVMMTWAVDRLGRSLFDLLDTAKVLESAKVNLYFHKEQIDTTTSIGRAMFQMTGVFAELERNAIQERVMAGLRRAWAAGKKSGPKFAEPETVDEIRAALADGLGLRATARRCGVGHSLVQRVRAESAHKSPPT